MKESHYFLILLLIALNGCASEKHFEFFDAPINGNIDSFSNELVKLGFTEPKLTEENQIKLNGVFLDKNCEIIVYGSSKSKTAYKVTVNRPKEVRDSLEKSFGKIQELYSIKYGKGINRYQQYRNSDRFHFNEPGRMRHLRTGDNTRYITGSGMIILEVMDGYISITYLDKLNNGIRKIELEEQAINFLP